MKSLFIADGQSHVRKAIKLALENQQSLIVSGEARHAESLLAQVCQTPPDVILMDWQLPGINPPRLIRTIKAHCQGTRLYVMSVKPEDETTAIQLGADGFLSKQINPEEFIQQLIEWISTNT